MFFGLSPLFDMSRNVERWPGRVLDMSTGLVDTASTLASSRGQPFAGTRHMSCLARVCSR
jgi:hypothetical protein